MGASMINPRQGQAQLDFSSLNLNVPAVPPLVPAAPPFNFDREAQLTRKIRDLEEELRLSRVEIEKQVRFSVFFTAIIPLLNGITAHANSTLPREVGSVEGERKAKEGNKSCCRGYQVRCGSTDRGGSRSGARSDRHCVMFENPEFICV